MKHRLHYLLLASLLFHSAFAMEQHCKLWTQAIVIGPLYHQDKALYYFEPRFRLIDNRYKFEEGSAYIGLGYQATSSLQLFAGFAYLKSQNLSGEYFTETRVWQQLLWNMINTNQFNLIDRTRFDIRKRTGQTQHALRIRERLMLRIPVFCSQKYSLVIFDEVFLNLNHPIWVSKKFLADNRLFIGVGTQLTSIVSIDVGYLNQYQFQSTKTTMSNGVYTTLNVNLT